MKFDGESLLCRPRTFLRLSGVDVNEFRAILAAVERLWLECGVAKYKRPGRNHALPMADQLLATLIRGRFRVTYDVLSIYFSADRVTIFRAIGRVEPLLRQIVPFDGSKSRSAKELALLVADTY